MRPKSKRVPINKPRTAFERFASRNPVVDTLAQEFPLTTKIIWDAGCRHGHKMAGIKKRRGV